jgi:hypothetical protein
MPEELNYDSEVIELKEVIKGLQAEFIEAHKALDTAREEVKWVTWAAAVPILIRHTEQLCYQGNLHVSTLW